MTAQERPAFPGAPAGSWVTEEGWLVVGDEAWTEHEWALRAYEMPQRAIRYDNDQDREDAKRRARQDYRDRQRQRVDSPT